MFNMIKGGTSTVCDNIEWTLAPFGKIGISIPLEAGVRDSGAGEIEWVWKERKATWQMVWDLLPTVIQPIESHCINYHVFL